jgi:hypothetical protein
MGELDMVPSPNHSRRAERFGHIWAGKSSAIDIADSAPNFGAEP